MVYYVNSRIRVPRPHYREGSLVLFMSVTHGTSAAALGLYP